MKKYLFTAIKAISLCAALLILLTACFDKRKNYEQAKADCASFLESHRSDLTELAENASDTGSGQYENCEYCYESIDGVDYVIFEFDAQGALGGQYWGIYYSFDDEFCDEYGTEELDKNRRYYRESDGNDFFATERLSENWFFFYQDYDGNVHGLDWGE